MAQWEFSLRPDSVLVVQQFSTVDFNAIAQGSILAVYMCFISLGRKLKFLANCSTIFSEGRPEAALISLPTILRLSTCKGRRPGLG